LVGRRKEKIVEAQENDDEMSEDPTSDSEMDKDIEDEDDEEEEEYDDDLSIEEEEEEFEEDDDLDENDSVQGGQNSDATLSADLFQKHFGKKPLTSDELAKTNGNTSIITVSESIELHVTDPIVRTDSDLLTLNAKTSPRDLSALAETSFQVNRKLLQHRWKRIQKSGLTENQSPIYPFLTRYMDLLVTTSNRKVRRFRCQLDSCGFMIQWITCKDDSFSPFINYRIARNSIACTFCTFLTTS
jgi:hypothetical protein